MFRRREYADKSTEHELKAALCVLWRKFRYRWLLSDDELQLRNKIDDEPSARADCLTNGVSPLAQLCFALAQKGTDKGLKGLRQSGVRDVALVLIEFA